MDLRQIRGAADAYRERVDADGRARLDFFETVWEAMNRRQTALDQREDRPRYALPTAEEARACYEALQPVFMVYPYGVDQEFLAECAAELTTVLCQGADYPEAVERELGGLLWSEVLADRDGLAGRDPSEWLIDVEAAATRAVVKAADDETPVYVGRLAALIASLALKIQLEAPAAAVMELLDGGAEAPHQTLCPVCGSSPMMAHVGGPSATDGRGRRLVCPQCAASWEFERIRCARCGTRHESALHYYHIEGDASHRLSTCDECGGYIRTLFSERDLLPVAYEVEDVVMAPLDAIAAQALAAESARIS